MALSRVAASLPRTLRQAALRCSAPAPRRLLSASADAAVGEELKLRDLPAALKYEENPEYKSVLDEYGVFPIAGFIGAYAISTELIVVNPESLLATFLLAFYTVIFNVSKQPVVQLLAEYQQEEEKIINDGVDALKKNYLDKIEAESKLVNLTDIVERVATYRANLASQALEAKVRKSKARRVQSVKERLTRVAAFEQDLKTKRSQLKQSMVHYQVLSSVTKKITKDQQGKINAWLIEHLATGSQAPLDNINEFVRKEVAAARSALSQGIPDDVRQKFDHQVKDLERQEQFFQNLINRSD